MKYLRNLSLAAVVIMAATALVTGGASAATKLCVSTPGLTANECPANKSEPNPSSNVHIEAKVTNPPGLVITTNITTVTCEEASMTITANTSTNVSPTTSITGEVTNLAEGNCKTAAGQACTTTIVNLPYEMHLQGTIEGLTNTSSLTITDAVGAGFKSVCGFVINCTFTTKEMTLHGVNKTTPTTTEFTASHVPLSRAGGICPATAELDATFQVTTPSGFTVH